MISVWPGSGLLLGLLLVTAILGGFIAHWCHLPRVIGFLIGGVALRSAIFYFCVSKSNPDFEQTILDSFATLKPIKELALGLLLFTIGSVFERTTLRATAPRVSRISVMEISLTLILVFTGCFLASWFTQSQYGLNANFALAWLLAIGAIATAPAATLFVLQEYESKGPITDTILGLTGMNNVIGIVLFYVSYLILASAGVIETTSPFNAHPFLGLTVTTLGSVIVGLLFGMLLSMIHSKLPVSETLLVFFAVFILLNAGEEMMHHHFGMSYNVLLVALVTGGVFANVAVDSQKLSDLLRTVGDPIYILFFVMAGFSLHLQDLTHLGWIGVVYIVCRFTAKIIGCHFGVKWADAPDRADGRLGTAMLCQAAVVIGFASFIEENWSSELANQFVTVIFGSVVVFELTGPVLLKRCVVQGGEVKAITLLHRGGSSAGGASVVRMTFQSLLRLFGWNRSTEDDTSTMMVEHVMRTNVQLIPSSATLDEVLHFIERSTYSHFPVVHEGGEFVGMIHFSEVRDVIYDPMLSELVTAEDLTDPDSMMVPMDMTLDALLGVFTQQNVAVMPVSEKKDSRHIVGLVEQRDLLRVLHLSRLPAN